MTNDRHSFYVSGYGKASEEAICLAELAADGTLRKMKGFTGAAQPSYLALHEMHGERFLYTFEKDPPDGAVLAYRVFPDRLELLSRCKADFLGPCHVSVSERGDFVYFASYGKGTVAVFRINEDGGLAFSSMVRHEGRGAHPLRQDRPHPHFAAETDGQLFVVDLGLDKVFVYNIDRESGELSPSGEDIVFPAGTGPRHLVFDKMHRDRLYVLSELTAEVFFLKKGASGWEIRQAVSAVPGLSADPALMVPQTADVLSIGAAIKLSEDGRYVFATCRLGYQTVSAFRASEDGGLHFCDAVRTGGITPRDIEVVGDTVIAAHQDSGLVTAVPFDRASERFGGVASSLALPSPTCVVSV